MIGDDEDAGVHDVDRRGDGLRKAGLVCCVLAATVLLASCTGGPAHAPASPVTSAAVGAPACGYRPSGVVGYTRSPGFAAGARLVLGRVSVDTGDADRPVPVQGNEPWRYWQKRGILILAGTGPVSVSVPSSWRGRAAITWGNKGIVGSLVLTACRQPSGVWDAYAGGIYTRAVTACVPLVFTLGGRSVTVPVSLAGRCG
jgi:hypothetical protein